MGGQMLDTETYGCTYNETEGVFPIGQWKESVVFI